MHKDENGYIVIETIGAFIPFVFLIVSILSLINIVTLQSRVHYALTQSANTLSMYSYTLEVTGVAKNLVTMGNKANKVTKEIDGMKDDISAVFTGLNGLSGAEAVVDRASGWATSAGENPTEALQGLLNCAMAEGSKAAFSGLARSIVSGYLANGDMTGDEYLKSVNVIGGLDGLIFYDFDLFDINSTGENDSVLIDKDGNVKLVVRYDVEYKFGILPLPFNPKLSITQSVKTKAWLNGSGKGYW